MGLYLGVAAALVLFGLVALNAGHVEQLRLKGLRQVRCGDDVPPDEEVKVIAAAAAGTPILAPLSEKPCVLYTLTLEYRIPRVITPGGNRDIRSLTTAGVAQDAALEDATGRLLLHPQEHRLHLGNLTSASAGLLAGPRVEKLAKDLLPSSHYVPVALLEHRLDAGDEALVVGRGEEAPGGRIIGGESRLELFAGGMRGHAQVGRGADLLAVALVVMGFCVAAWGVFGIPAEEDARNVPTTRLPRMQAYPSGP